MKLFLNSRIIHRICICTIRRIGPAGTIVKQQTVADPVSTLQLAVSSALTLTEIVTLSFVQNTWGDRTMGNEGPNSFFGIPIAVCVTETERRSDPAHLSKWCVEDGFPIMMWALYHPMLWEAVRWRLMGNEVMKLVLKVCGKKLFVQNVCVFG